MNNMQRGRGTATAFSAALLFCFLIAYASQTDFLFPARNSFRFSPVTDKAFVPIKALRNSQVNNQSSSIATSVSQRPSANSKSVTNLSPKSLVRLSAKELADVSGFHYANISENYWISEEKYNKAHKLKSFLPGSLPWSITETFSKCYVNEKLYNQQLRTAHSVCTYSEKEDFLFIFVPKCASTTLKRVMETEFSVKFSQPKVCLKYIAKTGDEVTMVAGVRDPFARFLSAFQEFMLRRVIHHDFHTEALIHIPEENREFAAQFVNLSSLDYSNFIKRPKGKALLMDSYEKFVRGYKDFNAYDLHVHLQVPYLTERSEKHQFDYIFDVTNMTDELNYVMRRLGRKQPIQKILSKRVALSAKSSTINVSRATAEKVCRINALDFCCLNMKLPEECIGTTYEDAQVHCQWIRDTSHPNRLLIAPVFRPVQ
mmetsp:Transcript_709/g.1086  ORF Transcript_709/g.1086 Transcript_709/m.1086 type:complete len:428 (+) Transcript_709:181-1464(+)